MKPGLLYTSSLNYTEENLAYLRDYFEIYKDALECENIEIILGTPYEFYGTPGLDLFPNLKLIASNTTSDSHIDVEYCKSRGIKVLTLEKDPVLEEITAVAELTWGLIICLTRNIIPASRSVLEGKWSRWPYGGPKMLSRMTLGVVGCYGRLGKMVLKGGGNFFKKINKFDICYHKQRPKYQLSRVLRYSDIITVHIPSKGNEGLFNREVFEQFKPGSYFINTSRGEIVDESALVWALETGKLAGAATDVLCGEFKPDFDVKKNALVRYAKEHDNLIITPHIGGSTQDAWDMTQRRIIEKVIEEYFGKESVGSNTREGGI